MIFTYFQSLILSICAFDLLRRIKYIKYFTKNEPRTITNSISDSDSDYETETESESESESEQGSEQGSDQESNQELKPDIDSNIDNQNIETTSDIDNQNIETTDSDSIMSINLIRSNVLNLIKKNVSTNKKLIDILINVDSTIDIDEFIELNNQMKKMTKLLF